MKILQIIAKVFNDLYTKIGENKKKKESGEQLSILPPFPRLAEKFPGFEKGKLIEITANSGVGKTKFTKFFCITSVYNFIKKNPNTKVKIWYFALEETHDDFWLSFISTMLYEKFNIELSPAQLKSLGTYTLDDLSYQRIKECEDFVTELTKFVEIIDFIYNPYGIYKYVRDYFENPEVGKYEYTLINEGKDKIISGYIHKEDVHYFVITDHITLLQPEKGMSEHQTLSHFSKEYCLKGFSRRFGCTVINIHQQMASSEQQEFYKGETIEQKLEPTLNGLGINKNTQQEDDLVIGLFAPARYNIAKYRGYDISKLGNNFITMIFLKDRHYGCGNLYVPLYFKGSTNYFEELPRAEEFIKNPKLYEKFI